MYCTLDVTWHAVGPKVDAHFATSFIVHDASKCEVARVVVVMEWVGKIEIVPYFVPNQVQVAQPTVGVTGVAAMFILNNPSI